MQFFNSASVNSLSDSSLVSNSAASASAMLVSQNAYGLADPLQNISRSSHACTKAGNYNADFDGNGKTDILWYNNRTGELKAWLMNGSSPTTAYYGTVAPSSGIALQGYGDFNSDGKTDILWQNMQTGEVTAWMMNGTNAPTSVSFGSATPGSGWTLEGLGDFDGNGKTDLFWYNQSSGQTAAWLVNGATLPTYVTYSTVAPDSGWTLEGMGDFCGDGKTDLLWYNQKTGDVAAWMMDGVNAPTAAMYGQLTPASGWALKGMGDLSGNGKTDLFWYNQQTGETSAWMIDTTSCTAKISCGTMSLQEGWTFEGLADVTGNGKADAIWYNRRTGQIDTWMMNGTHTPDSFKQHQDTSSYWDIQAMGDFNGNGKVDMFWRNYGMFSDKTQTWSMSSNGGYTTASHGSEPTTSGWQVVSMSQLTGLNAG